MNIASPKLKEPVPLPDRLPVGGQDVLPACKGGDQHHKGALRQVKIGDESVHGPEAVAGIDDRCPSSWLSGLNAAVLRRTRDSSVRQEVVPTQTIRPPPLPGCDSAGPPSPERACSSSLCIWCSVTSSAFTGRKVPRPTWRVTKASLIPFCRILLQQLPGEVQSRRGGRCRTQGPGVHRLVALLVLELLLDIRWQRHFAQALQNLQENALDNETAPAGCRPPAPGSPSAVSAPSAEASTAWPCCIFRPGFTRHSQAPPPRSCSSSTSTGPACRQPLAQQAGGQHPGVVHHQAVPRIQIVRRYHKNAGAPARRCSGPAPKAGSCPAAPEASGQSAPPADHTKNHGFSWNFSTPFRKTCRIPRIIV